MTSSSLLHCFVAFIPIVLQNILSVWVVAINILDQYDNALSFLKCLDDHYTAVLADPFFFLEASLCCRLLHLSYFPHFPSIELHNQTLLHDFLTSPSGMRRIFFCSMLRLGWTCPCCAAQYNAVSVMICQSQARVSVQLSFCHLFLFGPPSKGKWRQPETINIPEVQPGTVCLQIYHQI